MECRVFENFQKSQKILIIPKMLKIVPKSVLTCLEHVLGQFFRNFFCPVFHGGSSLKNFSKKSKTFQNSKNAQNRSQKCPNVFGTCFGSIFSKFFFCPVFHGGSRLRKFSKKSKNFQNSENAQNRSQKCPNVF